MTNLALEIRTACEKKIAMLQQEIQRIRDGMETVIAALQGDNGGDREVNPLPTPMGKDPIKQKINRPTAKTDVDEGPNTRQRMLLAIDKLPLSGFGTAELLKTINSDGNPKPVNKNRALRVFNDLIHSGHVEVIGKRVGSKGGAYRKRLKEAASAESSLSIFNPSNSIEEEKGGSDYAR